MESPVSIERMDSRAIKNTSAPSFYDGLENLKGVDVNTNSLTFKSVNTRGFATFANDTFYAVGRWNGQFSSWIKLCRW